MNRRNGPRLPLLLLPALLLVVSCGVPISAEEITATAESQKFSQQLSTLDSATSSRAADTAAQDLRLSGTPGVVSTLAGLASSTPNASVTPNGSATPSASGTPNASTTPSGTPSASTTPGTPGTGTATVTPTATATLQPTAQVPTSDFGAQVVNLVNEYRVANGLSRLRAEPFITTASNNYAKYMATANFFGHTGPDGSSSETRLAAGGYVGCFWGETLAAGQGSPQDAVNTWKASGPHNSILLSADAVDIGVGYFYNVASYYKHYWVLMTGRPSC